MASVTYGPTGVNFSDYQTPTSIGGSSMASELLDHYEEGTWTPTIQHNTGTGTVVLNVGTSGYVKIGKLVYVRANCNQINLDADDADTGAYYGIRNLPFTCHETCSWMWGSVNDPVAAYGGYMSNASMYFLGEGSASPHGNPHQNGTTVNGWGANWGFNLAVTYTVAP